MKRADPLAGRCIIYAYDAYNLREGEAERLVAGRTNRSPTNRSVCERFENETPRRGEHFGKAHLDK